uniref:2c281dad-496c-410b-b80e-98e840b042ff-CDS n=1 Tax=Plasmodiophora brassicae TaxID=37360 RepID=A0A3P3YWB0_PLABS|nr:2c281dad-496c-410b-b80e-98e840b042ff-CDS [Plasmodiophora brassicae]
MLISFQCLVFSIFMFAIGLWGIVLNRKNVIILIMAVEILLLGASLNFIFFSIFMDDLKGQVFSLLILTVAASESAIGLAILVIFYKKHQNIDFDFIYGLRG